MKIYKRADNFYSVVDVQDGREVEVAVFNYYKSAIRFTRKHKGGR